MMEELDTGIGRPVDDVDRSGEKGNTWIFFTADNGVSFPRHNRDWRGSQE